MKKIVSLYLISFIFSSLLGQISSEKMSDTGETIKLYQEGKILYDKKKYKDAYPYFLKAAEAGNSDAMMHLGKMYYNGWGVAHNHETGKMWHEKAARLGNAESIRKLEKMNLHDSDSSH